MTDEEYSKAIYGILSSGRGYKAIADLIGSLEILNDNTITVMKEMKFERKVIKKICEGPDSNKEKMRTILQMME
jgi:hypothetical protein